VFYFSKEADNRNSLQPIYSEKSDDRLQQAVNGGLLLIPLCTIQELRNFRFDYEIT
jgi:hypothetical protein